MKLEGDSSLSSIIHKLNRDFRTISHGKWVRAAVAASGFHISAAGLLGIAGLVFAIRNVEALLPSFSRLRWSSPHGEDSLEEDLWVVPGLQNLGNNCFLNVILQALASCSPVKGFLQEITEERGSSLVEGCPQSLSLTVALASLLEELSTPQHGRTVLSPIKVMLAMDHYHSDFKLTSQQDAEEALLHLLSSLREEYVESYVPNDCSLADAVSFSNCRIHTPEKRVTQSERERWHQQFLGPFDGVLGSMLLCKSCSFQISLNFEIFHSLHLSPVLFNGARIVSLEGCLKQFLKEEKIDHYRCSNCWHIAATNYLCSIGGDETGIKKLRCCGDQESCDCEKLLGLESIPRLNTYSNIVKQLSVTRCPKILCVHLQRATVNDYGELVKLQGHISFPLNFNFSPCTSNSLQIRNEEDNLLKLQGKQYGQLFSHMDLLNMQFDANMLKHIYEQNGNGIYSENAISEDLRGVAFKSSTNSQDIQGKPNVPRTGGCLDNERDNMQTQAEQKVFDFCHSNSENVQKYRLVSVVEHFGKPGCGHYTVYRSVRVNSSNDKTGHSRDGGDTRWFCISDSEVYSVSENDVIAAKASLLFYEKIVEC